MNVGEMTTRFGSATPCPGTTGMAKDTSLPIECAEAESISYQAITL